MSSKIYITNGTQVNYGSGGGSIITYTNVTSGGAGGGGSGTIFVTYPLELTLEQQNREDIKDILEDMLDE